ncbi:MAG: Flp pilus assembly complex ATPase component TadA [Candidatus Omnitrophica bacterium]|nr:Flp pilus assembly complex ATPase component TadA [Candidatus Omnitrophota bacterium]
MPPVRPMARLVGERLVEKKIITQEQLQEAIRKQKTDQRPIGEILVSNGIVTEDQLMEVLSEQLGIPFLNIEFYEIDRQVLLLFPKEFLLEHLAVPLFKVHNTVTVAMADPLDIRTVDRLRVFSKCEIQPVFGTSSAITKVLDRLFGANQSLENVIKEVGDIVPIKGVAQGVAPAGPRPGAVAPPRLAGEPSAEEAQGLAAAAEKAPIIKLVDTILKQAVDSRASDIHFEPAQEGSNLRYRIDGILYDVSPPPKRLEAAIISRLKIMASLDIAERRLPQDGRIQLKFGEKEVDFRISTFPTIYGENVAIRVLDKSAIILSLEQLGFQPTVLQKFKRLIGRPNGILLVTGPTGSGKTTTLYAALRTIDAVRQNVITLEDPVEYRIPRVRQSQIDVKAGLTFASGLRSILRQDPDVIMIGEIRDKETAEIAIHAALTGHLVFSTLHTNDAAGAIARLIDMGVEPFLVASSLIGILAQRLVRTLCVKCKKPAQLPPEALAALQIKDLPKKGGIFASAGCEECKQSGFRGRTGIYELLEMTEPLRALTIRKASSNDIQAEAVREGMETLKQAGVAKVVEGITTVDEILRLTDFELLEE